MASREIEPVKTTSRREEEDGEEEIIVQLVKGATQRGLKCVNSVLLGAHFEQTCL